MADVAKRLAVLGCTGSIGRQTLEVARAFPRQFDVVGLAAGGNLPLLQEQMAEFKPKFVYYLQGQDQPLGRRCRYISPRRRFWPYSP